MNQIVDTLDKQDSLKDETIAELSAAAPIMVAVDFSDSSEAALRWAYGYAEAVKSPLEILHVIHDPADSPGTYSPNGGDVLEPMADVAKRRLDKFLDRVSGEDPEFSGLGGARRLCVAGLPATRILDVARAHGARLIVLGSQQRNGLGRLVHGSTAVHIARHAGIPVTIVKADG